MNVILLTLIILVMAYLKADNHWPYRPVLYFFSKSPKLAKTKREARRLAIFEEQLKRIRKQGLPTEVSLAALEKCLLSSSQAGFEREALIRQFTFRIFFQFIAISCMHFYLFGFIWIHANSAVYVVLYIVIFSSLFYFFYYNLPRDPLGNDEDFKVFWIQLSTAGECQGCIPDYLREILEAEKRQGVSKKNLRFSLIKRDMIESLDSYRNGLIRFSEYIVIFELMALLILLAGLVVVTLIELNTLTNPLGIVLG